MCSREYLLGRIVKFSYLEGNKRQQQFFGHTVELQKESCKNIGVFANWYSALSPVMYDTVEFKPIESQFTCGYITVKNHKCTIYETEVLESKKHSFSVKISYFDTILPDWRSKLSFNL